jgi:hypothetical protein
MGNEKQLKIILQGTEVWNVWKLKNSEKKVDLSNADLSGANLEEMMLHGANLSYASLNGANLYGADLSQANLSFAELNKANLAYAMLDGANLNGAELLRANFHLAKLRETNLREAFLLEANLNDADLYKANLNGANLNKAILVGAHLREANLTGCKIYGVSAWGLILEGAKQRDLLITPYDDYSMPAVTVDDLEVAQFIYLLLYSYKIRRVIDTITSKAVLILGRFTPERKAILDAIREELRRRGYVPLLFDFEKPASRDLRETVSTLAHMVKFIIADITDAKSIPAELERVVPYLSSVPVMPLVLRSDKGYALFDPLRVYPWVIEPYRYESQAELIASIVERVIAPAEAKVKERRKASMK